MMSSFIELSLIEELRVESRPRYDENGKRLNGAGRVARKCLLNAAHIVQMYSIPTDTSHTKVHLSNGDVFIVSESLVEIRAIMPTAPETQ